MSEVKEFIESVNLNELPEAAAEKLRVILRDDAVLSYPADGPEFLKMKEILTSKYPKSMPGYQAPAPEKIEPSADEVKEFMEVLTMLSESGDTDAAELLESLKIVYGDEMGHGGSIGFIPMDLEEELMNIAKWGGTDIHGVIGYLNAMIDSGVKDSDLKPNPTKNTLFQRERATEKKVAEIWKRIEPNYKGNLKGNMYYSTLKEIIGRNNIHSDLLKRYKPFRKLQKDQ